MERVNCRRLWCVFRRNFSVHKDWSETFKSCTSSLSSSPPLARADKRWAPCPGICGMSSGSVAVWGERKSLCSQTQVNSWQHCLNSGHGWCLYFSVPACWKLGRMGLFGSVLQESCACACQRCLVMVKTTPRCFDHTSGKVDLSCSSRRKESDLG